MALYRNIAGVNGASIGLSFGPVSSPTTFSFIDDPITEFYLPSPFQDPVTYQQDQQALSTAYEAEMKARYEFLLSTPYNKLKDAGYYVTTDNGSVFQYTDPSRTSSTSYIALDWIQRIENERGTAGALLLHMQEPALAKDTAGYEGGSSGTWYQESGVDPNTQVVSDPVPEVQVLPPVVPTGDGTVQFDPTQPQAPTPAGPPNTGGGAAPTSGTPLPTDFTTAIKNNLLPIAVIAGLAAVAVVGEDLLHKRRKLVFLGGVGALFYLMAKKQ